MTFETNQTEFENDYHDVVRLFYPNADFSVCDDNVNILHKMEVLNGLFVNSCVISDLEKQTSSARKEKEITFSSDLERKKLLKRFGKLSLYEALSKHFKKDMPWGSLTGIRPTRIAYDLMEQGVPKYLVKETMMKIFFVSEKKANLIMQIIKNQKCIIKNDNVVDLYVHIPICPSRCAYCSFISAELHCVENIMDDYVEALIKELSELKKIIINKSLIVRTIYVGGGTPTVLNDSQLEKLVKELSYPVSEFTVECGRPDTITESKLEILKKYGVTRICINPQTFNDKTLKHIKRNHTTKDIIEAYKIALSKGFDINMDIIAGLPLESFANFKKTIDTILELSPSNITIHTLSLKNGAKLVENGKVVENKGDLVSKMVDYGYAKLLVNGYEPYYLYRQKSQYENLENIGYQKKGKTCIFNVDSMEETCSILAVGAGAISKRVFHIENRIERSANVKDLREYISRINEMIDRKKNLFK